MAFISSLEGSSSAYSGLLCIWYFRSYYFGQIKLLDEYVLFVQSVNQSTRSGPKIPAAGYLEEERFLDLKNLSFGLMAFKMALKVHNGKWIGTSSEQPNLELGRNSDVLTKLDFWP